MLFVGDIGAATERDLLTDGQAENIDILKVPHHGSKTASEPAFLKAFDPEYAIISAGAGNPYHHPAPTTLGRLRDIGAAIYRTDRNGSVTLESDGQRITIRPER
jgi:competence protein ComEC